MTLLMNSVVSIRFRKLLGLCLLIFPCLGLAQENSSTQLIELRGQVTDFSFRTPASSISMVVSGIAGPANWVVEAPSASQLRRLGWNSSSLFTGEMIRVQARQIPGMPMQAELVSLTRANGALLLAGTQEDSGSLNLSAIPTGLYRLDQDHAYMTFSYDHMGFSRPQLKFERFSASLNFDSEAPENSDVRVEVDVSSLSSGVDALDRELRGEEFFDALNHPRISFRSEEISIDAWGHAQVRGTLEIKGISKDITLKVRLNRAALNQLTNMHTLGVTLTGELSRSEWGMNQHSSLVGDEIQIQIQAEFVQPIAR